MGGDKVSEYSKEKTDKMVNKLINDCYKIALNLINENSDSFNNLAKKLMQEKILDAKDFKNIKFNY